MNCKQLLMSRVVSINLYLVYFFTFCTSRVSSNHSSSLYFPSKISSYMSYIFYVPKTQTQRIQLEGLAYMTKNSPMWLVQLWCGCQQRSQSFPFISNTIVSNKQSSFRLATLLLTGPVLFNLCGTQLIGSSQQSVMTSKWLSCQGVPCVGAPT